MVLNSTGEMEVRNALNTPEPDTRGIKSIFGRLHYIEEHLHSTSRTAPELADALVLTAGSGAWSATGAITEIIASATITDRYDVHFVNLSAFSANGEYEIQLFEGSAGSEVQIASIPATRNAVQSQEGSQPTLTPKIDANERLSARVASGNVAADTLALKVVYHTY